LGASDQPVVRFAFCGRPVDRVDLAAAAAPLGLLPNRDEPIFASVRERVKRQTQNTRSRVVLVCCVNSARRRKSTVDADRPVIGSGHDLVDHPAVDIGESEVATGVAVR